MLTGRIAERESRRGPLFLVVVLGVLCLLGYVGLQMTILSLEESIRALRADRETVVRDIVYLEAQTAELRSGARIMSIAVEKLGMRLPEGAPEQLY
jgi:cell division protein FtsL